MTSALLRQTWGLGAAGPPGALGYGARAPEPGIRGWLQKRAPAEAAHTEALTADALQRLLSLEVQMMDRVLLSAAVNLSCGLLFGDAPAPDELCSHCDLVLL